MWNANLGGKVSRTFFYLKIIEKLEAELTQPRRSFSHHFWLQDRCNLPPKKKETLSLVRRQPVYWFSFLLGGTVYSSYSTGKPSINPLLRKFKPLSEFEDYKKFGACISKQSRWCFWKLNICPIDQGKKSIGSQFDPTLEGSEFLELLCSPSYRLGRWSGHPIPIKNCKR